MSATRALGDLRVLVVDDDDDQRAVVGRLFRHAGVVEIAEAGDADQALSQARATTPHLIVLDLAMPGRSGFDVLPDLVGAVPEALVVVLSNLPRRRLYGQLQQRGAVGYVEKRVAPERLVDEILMAAALTDVARHHVIELTGDVGSSSTGRRFVRGLMSEADHPILRDLELLVSELVTNAVVHATSDPRAEVRISADTVRVEVYDRDRSLPSPRTPEPEVPGGRGLQMVNRLASRWGSEQLDEGKVVWFEISRRSRGARDD